MSASRMPRLVLLDTKFVARQAALSARRTPTAGLNCAGDLLYGTTFSRSRLERQYGATEWIKLTVTCPERVRCADVGGANFSLPLNTLSCSAIFRSIAPRPLCCILRPPAPAADLCGIKLPHFVYPTGIVASSGCAFANCLPSLSNSLSASLIPSFSSRRQ